MQVNFKLNPIPIAIILLTALVFYFVSSSDSVSGGGTSPTIGTTTGFRVLIVETLADREKLPPDQLEILGSTLVHAYINAHCSKNTAGDPDFRDFFISQDLTGQDVIWKNAFAAVQTQPNFATPWLLATNGKKRYSGPLPANEAAMLKQLQAIGGQ